MAKVRGPLFSVEAAGAFGDQILFRRGPAGVRVSRPGVAPKSVRKKATAAQAEQRGYFKQAVAEWNALTDAGRAAVHAEALALGLPMNGYSLWLKRRVSELAIPFELDVEFQATHETGRYGDPQRFVIPRDGRYRLTAFGAQGGRSWGSPVGGLGAKMSGEFDLLAGTELSFIVGQAGFTYEDDDRPSGGGATIVMVNKPGQLEIGTRGVVLSLNNTLEGKTQTLMQRLEALGHELTVIHRADVETFDFSGFDYVFVSYWANTYSDFPGSALVSALPLHVISQDRYFSRNALLMSDGSDRETLSNVKLWCPLHPLADWFNSRSPALFEDASSLYGHVLGEVRPGTFAVLASYGHDDEIFWADRMENGFLRRHIGPRDWYKGTEEDYELFDQAFLCRAPSSDDILLIAGGAGACHAPSVPSAAALALAHGHVGPDGNDGLGSWSFGAGGVAGHSGEPSIDGSYFAGGGAGLWFGGSESADGGALIYDAEGGHGYTNMAVGGFGGGGCVRRISTESYAAGGGGYGGGGGGAGYPDGDESAGGGGGSLNQGENQDNQTGARAGAGLFRVEAV